MKLTYLIILFIFSYTLNSKTPLTKGETDQVMLDLDPYMIEALSSSKGRFKSEGSLVDLMKEPAFQKLIDKHKLLLFNGPMLGDLTSTSVKVWVRSAGPADFQVVIDKHKSAIIKTNAKNDFTGIATIRGLKPSTNYNYSIILNGKKIQKPYFNFKTAAEAGQKTKFSIAFGSGARYVPANEGIWRAMAQSKPIAYLGLGDNVYIDSTNRRGTQRLHYYRRMLRQEYREIIAGTAIYAVWDDHDMAMNDSAGGKGLEAPWKLPNFKVFKENWNNPFYGEEPKNPATYHNFKLGDVEVFMLDNRFYRSLKSETPTTMLGLQQKKWLLSSLKKSTAKFKILASGTMWNDLADKGGKDSWASPKFRAERDEIFNLIKKEKINGVLLLAGDRHRSDIWKIERPNAYPFYEFVTAKLTNLHTHPTRKEALWSYNKGNFWGQLDFDFTQSDPVVTFKTIDATGKEIKAFPLKLSELSHK